MEDLGVQGGERGYNRSRLILMAAEDEVVYSGAV